jgi:predicted nucleotidyltransferase
MSYISHTDIADFADNYVNLKKDDATEYREQVNRLRLKLETYLAENPDFAIRKMILSGSLAKGTALKDINDIDVAVYVSSKEVPDSTAELIDWLAERLRSAFPNFTPEQVVANPSTLTVSFKGSGLMVDVVPILYDGDVDWKGYLISRHTGEKILTSIPLHLEFLRSRKKKYGDHYTQIIRLMKFWVKQRKIEDPDFRFKSYMIELILAQMVSEGLGLSDYPETLAEIFAYIASDNLETSIVFSDNYDPNLCADSPDVIHIWDPVNHENNISKKYTEHQRQIIVDAALDAGDAIDAALRAHTKTEALRYWRKVFGSSFN